LVITGGLAGGLGLGVWHPRQLHRLLHWLQGAANRLGRWGGRPVLLVEELIRSVLVRQPASPAEQAQARKVVERYGRSALARMTLFNDKSYFFSRE
jgi:hypothetical protein